MSEPLWLHVLLWHAAAAAPDAAACQSVQASNDACLMVRLNVIARSALQARRTMLLRSPTSVVPETACCCHCWEGGVGTSTQVKHSTNVLVFVMCTSVARTSQS